MKKWIVFTLSGKYDFLCVLTNEPNRQKKKKKKCLQSIVMISPTGTTLIHGENSLTWMKRKRKKLNGEFLH